MRGYLTRSVIACLFYASAISAQTPEFDPRSWKGAHAGPPTEVLTLGSMHLSQMERPATPEMLEPLLAKLIAFKPDIVTHEGLSGEQCDQVRRYKLRYPSIWIDYCRGTEEAEFATGLNVPEAMAEVQKTLASWPASATAAQRRKLASLFLAAGDRPSAQVQWLQLPVAERKAEDGIDAELLKILERKGAKPNETFDVAAVVAARLGLQRVYAVDDHTADSIHGNAAKGYEEAITKHFQSAGAIKEVTDYRAAEGRARSGEDMLQLYRLINNPATTRAFITTDFGAALKQQTLQLFGRQYVAWMETRNLRMVANVRAAFANRPGARVLNVVGASHKPYYDAYLNMMHEVKLVDAESVLK